MPRIAVVGSANMDLVVQCEALPRTGETVTGHGFARHPGGKGANQAVAAGRLASSTTAAGDALAGLQAIIVIGPAPLPLLPGSTAPNWPAR